MKKFLGIRPIHFILILLMLTGVVGAVSARYISSLQGQDSTFTAPIFYFRSNAMTEESDPTPIVVKGNQTSVVLANGTGAEQYSNVDIFYTLRYYIEKDGNWLLVNTVEGQKLEKDLFSFSNLILEPIEYESETYKTIKVEAESVAPFTKTLRACVTFQTMSFTVEYTYDDFIITANLQTNVSSGMFDLSWVAGISPDSGDENGVLNTAPIGPASIHPALEANHTYLLKFYVTDESIHNAIMSALDQSAYIAEELISISKG